MNSVEFLAQLAKDTNITKKEVKAFLDRISEIVKVEMLKKGKISLPGIGTLSYKTAAARSCINPSTKQKMNIPSKGKVGFNACVELKEAISKIV